MLTLVGPPGMARWVRSQPDSAPFSGDVPFDRARVLRIVRIATVVVLVVLLALQSTAERTGPLSIFLLGHQDIIFVPLVLATLFVSPRVRTAPPIAVPPDRREAAAVIALAVLMLLLCWAGRGLVFAGHDLSHDEQMADFDAFIFSHGRLFWPILPAWRPFGAALNQLFMLPIGDYAGWVSGYLPVNAAIRALIGLAGEPALTSPLLVAVGALALWRIAVRLWPDSRPTRAVVLTLYACSAQIVVTGMTGYAMTAHLALDLVWLALFLRGGRAGHGGAIMVAFLATGLHQPIFHPLFALPFLDLLRRERRWRLLAIYLVAYALIIGFWLAWPQWLSAQAPAPSSIGEATPVGIAARLGEIVGATSPFATLWLMTENLLRFVTWQHLMLPLLMVPGGIVAWRGEPLARAFAIGLLLPILASALLVSYQGHGWGYRYLHGVLGNAILLGGYGWQRLERTGHTLAKPFLVATAATLLVLLPARMIAAHRFAAPFAAVDRAIAATDADVVIVDDDSVPFTRDLVINRPDLGNRPVRLLASKLGPGQMAALCARRSVAFMDGAAFQPVVAMFGLPAARATHIDRALRAAASAAGCRLAPPA